MLSDEDVERLFHEHAVAVLGYLARRVLDPDVAVDLMAETFAQTYRDRRQFRGTSEKDAVAWVFGIARHCTSSYLRRGQIERRALRRLGVERRALEEDEYERIEELAGMRELVRDRFAQLDSEQRDALRLRVIEDRPYSVVAQRLGVSEPAARARVSRALRALRAATPFIEEGKSHA